MKYIASNVDFLPTLLGYENATLDLNLLNKTDLCCQIGKGIRIGKHNVHTATITAFKLKPNSGYDTDCCVVRLMDADTVMQASAELYVFRITDWEKIRDIAISREHQAGPNQYA